jgi:transcriptional regulator with XRE-family HTH domain
MEAERQTAIGKLIYERRTELGLSMTQLAKLAGINRTQVSRLEDGYSAVPYPDTLVRLAAALRVPSADLFAIAGYQLPDELPTLRPYLRAKYGPLPDEALATVEEYLAGVAQQYGYQPGVPSDGEDEWDDEAEHQERRT